MYYEITNEPGCGGRPKESKKKFNYTIMKNICFVVAGMFLLVVPTLAQDAPIFPPGEKAPNVHHTGNVRLKELMAPDSIMDCQVSVASFEAGAKLDWHKHPGGQILLVTAGTGYYQERGMRKQVIRKGDVIKCRPGVEHWHGASPASEFTYIAINTNTAKGRTIWLEKLTDADYTSGDSPAPASTDAASEIINLSKTKWRWMSEKKVDSLAALFDDKAVFVHMGGTMSKEQELNIIQTGGIHYKHAEILETSVKFIGHTAILLNKIRLEAVVGGNEVVNPFVVTEVYVQQGDKWMLGSLSFTRLLTQ